jgi:prepilin-type N-terminal cleavage/methylation domain-containing protein
MKKNNKGFTLAELLIVVAIIAVLVAIAIPVAEVRRT